MNKPQKRKNDQGHTAAPFFLHTPPHTSPRLFAPRALSPASYFLYITQPRLRGSVASSLQILSLSTTTSIATPRVSFFFLFFSFFSIHFCALARSFAGEEVCMHLHRHAEVPIPLSLSLSIYVGMRGGTGGKSAGPGTDLRQWEEEMPPIFFFFLGRRCS